MNAYQGIVIYPSVAKLVRYLALELVILAVMAAIFPIFTGEQIHDLRAYAALVAAVVVIPWIGFVALFTAYRVIVRKPAVLVNEEGITDNCSLIASGMGLIRWREMETLYPYVYEVSQRGIKIRRPYLVIVPVDTRAILTRRGPLAQMLRRLLTLTLPAGITLPEWMLTIPVAELLSEIRTQYHRQLLLHKIDLFTEDRRA
jgi:hypothetical protein